MSSPITAPPPPPFDERLVPQAAAVLRAERRARRAGVPLPAGSRGPSWRNTYATLADPLRLLLDHRRRFGPVFTIRTVHEPVVWAIGAPENHQILVSDADAYQWRESRFGDLHPVLGDGMLNIDGELHHQLRRLMLPAFHREQVEAVAGVMVSEGERAADRLEPGAEIDLYAWTRELALRIALRGLLGLDEGDSRAPALADAFERALALYGHPFVVQLLRGPRTPYATAQRACGELDALVRALIDDHREQGADAPGVLGLLLGATDADGHPLDEQLVRDQLVTLLFAGHDTTTATLTFMMYELGRTPAARVAVQAELAAVLGDRDPRPDELDGATLPVLERTLDETLRRYPAAWVGPRRALRDTEISGVKVPAGIAVHYCSWATHHLPELYPDPLAFEPDRFLPERAKTLPKGAYIPFGGGSRMCLGKRFGQYELRALAAVLLRRFDLDPDPGDAPRITTTPTLGPRGGLRFAVKPANGRSALP